MEKKFHKKAFTLIEMLIVIVIIWVLAAALIPRLTSVRDRANDVARKADLNQLATAIIARQMDHNGLLPWGIDDTTLPMSAIQTELKDAGLDSVPQDPRSVTSVSGLWTWTTLSWQYAYLRIAKNWIAGGAFVVMAKMETPGASNWLYNVTSWSIHSGDDSTALIPCKSMTKSLTGMSLIPWWDCFFSNLDQLRFMIIR